MTSSSWRLVGRAALELEVDAHVRRATGVESRSVEMYCGLA